MTVKYLKKYQMAGEEIINGDKSLIDCKCSKHGNIL